MMILLLASLLRAAPPPPPPPPPPLLMPLFLSRSVENGPAFAVECRNMTGATITSASSFWPLEEDAIRIDSVGLEHRGRVGPGLTADIPPYGTWRAIIELQQAEPQTGFAVALGADVRAQFVVPLTAGRHWLAVRCGNMWLELPFYWER